MKRSISMLLAVFFVFCCQAAQARPAHADTMRVSSPWQKKEAWSAGHPPTVEEEAVIPPGVTARVERSTTSGPLRDEGHVVGSQQLTVFGSVTLAPGSFDLDGTLDLKGWGTITAEDTIYYLRIDGNDTLAAPLHAGVLTAYKGSTLVTNDEPVTVDTETYPFGEADWLLGKSTYTTGYWLVFPASLGGEVHAEEATIVVTGSGGGLLSGVLKAEDWTYGNVTFTGEGQWRGNGIVAGALTIDGPTTIEAGRTIRVGSLATDGTTEMPERLSVAGSGTAVVECGCAVPVGLALEGVEVR